MALSCEQVASFHKNGYLVVENFATEQQCDGLRERVVKIIDAFDPKESNGSIFTTYEEKRRSNDDYFLNSGDKIRCFFEEKAFLEDGVTLRQSKHLSINKIGHAMHEKDDVFRAFTDNQDVYDMVVSLGFQVPVLLQGMYIFKQPKIGGAVNPHQDSTFLFTDPPSAVGLWFPLEDATLTNGCLWAVPGSQEIGIHRRLVRTEKGDSTHFVPAEAKPFNIEGAVPLEIKKGGVVLIHGALVHFSSENTSAVSRHAYTVHVIEQADGWTYPADNWLQREDGKPWMHFDPKWSAAAAARPANGKEAALLAAVNGHGKEEVVVAAGQVMGGEVN